MKYTDYKAYLKTEGLSSVPNVPRAAESESTQSSSRLRNRCTSEHIYTMYDDQTFVGNDVTMSSVVKADTDTATVGVTAGYSLSNSLAASASLTPTLPVLSDFLSTTFGLTSTTTWTTSVSTSYTFTVPAGKYGVVVSNPVTLRKSGHLDIGCLGQISVSGDFTADSYTSHDYAGLGWVEGVIRLCTGDIYPVPMCTGNGTIS